MKKTIRLFAILAILLGAVSCQDNGLDNGQVIDNGKLTITATIATPDATRVTYDVDNEVNHKITPAWTVGDKIIGFDDDDHTFTFTVESIDGSGKATLNTSGYTKGNATKLYAIYYPGKTPANFTGSGASTKLAVDLTTQNGAVLNDNSPALMCATGTIEAGSVNFSFVNQTAIIGVTQFKLPLAATLTSVSVDGLITNGTFELNVSGDLVLTPGTTPSTITATGSWATAGVDNICETPLYFATLPTASAKIALRASDGVSDYGNLASIAAKNIVAGKYYYMKKNLGEPVAEVAGVKYGTIDDAFAAANRAASAVTITLLANCTAAARLPLNGSGSGAITLDLNGKTITMTNQIRVDGRKLTIKDTSSDDPAEQGSVSATYTGGRVVYVNGDGASLTLLGGNVIQNGDNDVIAILSSAEGIFEGGSVLAKGGYALYVGAATATINGGSFTRTGTGGYTVYTNSSTAEITITGGTFSNIEGTSTNPMVYASSGGGKITVTGGYFNANGINPVWCNGSTADDGVAYVKGGYYNKALQQKPLKDDSANLYTNTLNTSPATSVTYPFTISAADSVATVDQGGYHWNHATLESALKNADMRAISNGPSTVMLLDDVTVSSTMSVSSGNPYPITLNLEDYNITSSSSPVMSVASDLSIVAGSGEFVTTGATALEVTAGTTTLSSASLVAGTNAVTVNGGSLVITGGHYYGGGVADIVKNTGSVSITGGWFRSEPAAALMASGYSSEPGSETFNERSYAYTVVGVVATVNGSNYYSWSDAVTAVNAYAGPADTAVLQLQLNISGASPAALNNTSKPIKLDLNGHTLSTVEESFITITGTNKVVITDTAVEKGRITSSNYKIISLTTSGGKVDIKGCVIESTAAANATYANAVVSVDCTSKMTRPDVIFDDGAKVYSSNAHCVCYSKYGTMTFNDCEITSGKEVDNGFHGIFINTGGIITINDGASIYSRHTSGDINGAAIRSGTGNSASTITVNGGWIHGGYSVNAGSGYSNRYFINAGYYNDDFSKYGNMTEMVYPGGKALKAMSERTHFHATTGETLSYGYQIEMSSVIVNGAGYSTLADAAAAAVADDGEKEIITLQLQEDVTYNTALNLTHASKPVVLDLNGHILSTTVADFIHPISGKLTITDSQDKVGKITSSSYQVVYAGGSSKITLKNCILEGTKETAAGYDSESLIFSGSTSSTDVTGCRIYTNGKQTAWMIFNSSCSVTVTDSEITTGKVNGDGLNGFFVKNGSLTFKSGSVYKRGSNEQPAIGTYSNSGSIVTIDNGYFFSEGTRALRKAKTSSMTLNGGYMNLEPSSGGSPAIGYGSGKSLQDCSVDHVHATTGTTLHYTKVVTTTP